MSTAGEFPVNSLRICIEHRNGNEISGFLCSIALKEKMCFDSKMQFVLKVNEAYDRIGQPQPQQVLRSFREQDRPQYNSYKGSPTRFHTSEEIRKYSGSEATYDLVMVSRKYAEWQGILKSADGGIKGSFESVLQCLEIL